MDISVKGSKDGTKSSLSAVVQQDYIQSESTFFFRNGDKYEGEYLAIRNPLMIVREGQGTYSTNDNVEMRGTWRNDLLAKANDIIWYPDRTRFTGTLQNMTLDGFGVYTFKENVQIKGDMINNQFYGNVELRDPLGHLWLGLNLYDEAEVFFYPAHPFWQSLLESSADDFLVGEGEY